MVDSQLKDCFPNEPNIDWSVADGAVNLGLDVHIGSEVPKTSESMRILLCKADWNHSTIKLCVYKQA